MQFLKNGFLLALIVVVYLQPWLKNKLVYVQCAKAVIGIPLKDSTIRKNNSEHTVPTIEAIVSEAFD